ncbi:MAG: polyprenol monophosphomannose synthase [Acidobacteriia bacterium]|nr:polyprenol monophosphomannose synthase [Terriglobia bacterium]
MKAVVVVPTYNERDNLENLVLQIRQQPCACHILIVDDRSPDGTGAIADRLAADFPGEVFVLHRARKEGLGRAYVAALRHVLECDYDIVIQMDADLSHSPSYLPDLLREISHHDLVLGSRYVRGVNVVNWDFKRLVLSKLATQYVRLVTGMRFTDATTGFKCWRREVLESLDLDRLLSNGYLFQIETTYRTHRMGYRIAEVPIIFYERDFGRSKIDFHIIAEALLGVIQLRLRRSPCRRAATAPSRRKRLPASG